MDALDRFLTRLGTQPGHTPEGVAVEPAGGPQSPSVFTRSPALLSLPTPLPSAERAGSDPLRLDPDRPPVPAPRPTDADVYRDLAIRLDRLIGVLTPGTNGIPGFEDVPEGQTEQRTLTAAQGVQPIVGNGKRTSMVVYNAGPDATEFHYTDPGFAIGQGQPIPAGSEREFKVRARVYVRSAGTSDLRISQESS